MANRGFGGPIFRLFAMINIGRYPGAVHHELVHVERRDFAAGQAHPAHFRGYSFVTPVEGCVDERNAVYD